jgi:hypothetical protein
MLNFISPPITTEWYQEKEETHFECKKIKRIFYRFGSATPPHSQGYKNKKPVSRTAQRTRRRLRRLLCNP